MHVVFLRSFHEIYEILTSTCNIFHSKLKFKAKVKFKVYLFYSTERMFWVEWNNVVLCSFTYIYPVSFVMVVVDGVPPTFDKQTDKLRITLGSIQMGS